MGIETSETVKGVLNSLYWIAFIVEAMVDEAYQSDTLLKDIRRYVDLGE